MINSEIINSFKEKYGKDVIIRVFGMNTVYIKLGDTIIHKNIMNYNFQYKNKIN